MASFIGRRKFLATLGGAAAAWPFAARAQQSERMRRVGALMGFAESDREGQIFIAAFREGLHNLGWTEGRNIRFDNCRASSTAFPMNQPPNASFCLSKGVGKYDWHRAD
jgi:putative tryptophan/tyrosine transport system substrate-binding protein